MGTNGRHTQEAITAARGGGGLLYFTVDVWTSGGALAATLARAATLAIGVAAFEAAVAARAGQHVTLRNGALVLRDSAETPQRA